MLQCNTSFKALGCCNPALLLGPGVLLSPRTHRRASFFLSFFPALKQKGAKKKRAPKKKKRAPKNRPSETKLSASNGWECQEKLGQQLIGTSCIARKSAPSAHNTRTRRTPLKASRTKRGDRSTTCNARRRSYTYFHSTKLHLHPFYAGATVVASRHPNLTAKCLEGSGQSSQENEAKNPLCAINLCVRIK